MSQKLTTSFVILVFILLAMLALSAMSGVDGDVPNRISQQGTFMTGQNPLVADIQVDMHVIVRDTRDALLKALKVFSSHFVPITVYPIGGHEGWVGSLLGIQQGRLQSFL